MGPISVAVAALVIAGATGCDQTGPSAEDRGEEAVDLCRDHGGVAALDDDIVICRDESVHEGEV